MIEAEFVDAEFELDVSDCELGPDAIRAVLGTGVGDGQNRSAAPTRAS